MFSKRVEILADSNSWPLKRVPADIQKIVGHWNPDILVALIHTALWTRPPVSHGIHLSDFWAWLRYHRAISETEPELRLCKEWNDVDPHQKTILSDELGVGFTTYLLAEKLGCLGFVDTLYLQRRLRKHFSSSRSRRGRDKSPDYISIDRSNRLYILECKGTQSSRASLSDAMLRGQEQKKSVSVSQPTLIKHSLVAGLFIPQWKNKKHYPCIMLADPSWQDVERALLDSSQLDRNTSILQILLAKHLSLIGLAAIAQALVETDARQFEFTSSMQDSISRWLRIPMIDNKRVIIDTESDTNNILQNSMESPYSIQFSVGLPQELERILTIFVNSRIEASIVFRAFFLELQRQVLPTEDDVLQGGIADNYRPWGAYSSESSSTLTSPLGFEFSLVVSRSVSTISA
jgi:hypothetical protein